jgi:two-component system chemotaxis sensor kinase CheA
MALDLNLDAARGIFFTEARQLLGEVETYVLQLEQDPSDKETLNAAFREAHTIKGSAGVFGFAGVTHFVHDLETVLDRVRNGEIGFDGPMSTLVLSCRDHIATLVDLLDAGAEDGEVPDDVKTVQQGLTARLKAYLQGNGIEKTVAAAPEVHAPAAPQQAVERTWQISVRLAASTLCDGFDPRPIFNYLDTFGEIVVLNPVLDSIPAFSQADPEQCYLGFELVFKTEKSHADILESFEFLAEPSKIIITPHDCDRASFHSLIAALPEEKERATALLAACGFNEPAEKPVVVSVAAHVEQSAATQAGQVLAAAQASAAVVPAAPAKAAPKAKSSTQSSAFIRVPADKLDTLINLVGELVIANAGTVERAKQLNDSGMVESTSAVAALIEEIRDGALGLRMVQIGETFHRFQRVVRDLSMGLGKQIALDISGEDTELDKSVVERIGDPLMHLVRNAIDHGLETEEERALTGKSMVGRIGLNAYHDSGHIVIEVSDDGRGLNRDKILRKAIEKGLIPPDVPLSDQEINQLVFLPGFSTADKVTDISGRGVGMDVVKRNIEALRGTVRVRSTIGAGSTFEIRLPLTLAIIDGFLIGVGDSHYVIPLGFVRECLELSATDIPDDRVDLHYDLRGEFLPCVRLRNIFGVKDSRPKRENIIVVSFGDTRAGLIADQLDGESQTVIKPLGALFESNRAISGATILGSGEVALIIDVPKLISEVSKRSAPVADNNH